VGHSTSISGRVCKAMSFSYLPILHVLKETLTRSLFHEPAGTATIRRADTGFRAKARGIRGLWGGWL
jgi:hypothetical protein